jgi:amphi-Trp domain-containing protein
MTLKQGSDEITIEFPKDMVLELKVEEEQGKRLKKSLEIELEWIVGDDQEVDTMIL